MKKLGRPSSPYKTRIEPISEVIGKDDEHPPEHEIHSALSTLMEAEKIKADPKMMGHVHEAAKTKITSLKDLKKLAWKKSIPK